jgi:hypothetical protein
MKKSFFSAKKAFPMRSFTFYVTFFLLISRQTNAILNKIMNLFHNEIISQCRIRVKFTVTFMFMTYTFLVYKQLSCNLFIP